MVGVGGRSKACENCRRRRIKCDLTQPACRRCIKANLQCGGSRSITFVRYEGKNSKHEFGTALAPLEKTQSPSFPKSPLESLSGFMINPSIPHDEVFVNYARVHFFRGPDAEFIVTTGIDRSLASGSFLALATTLFGAERKDGALIQRGLQSYGFSLEKLNQALGDPSRQHSFDLLEAVMNMAMFEYLVSERERGWVNHARGLERLMELRGPESFMSLPELMILERVRPSNIFAALVLQQPTILARPEWKSIPWTLYPDRKTAMQDLMDIFAECPGLVAAKRQLESEPIGDQTASQYQDLAIRAQCLLDELEQFQQSWDSTYSTSCWEIPSPATMPSFLDSKGETIPIFSTVLHYESLYHANVVTLSCAARILILLFSHDLSCFGSTPSEEQISCRLVAAGNVICRGLDYQLEEVRKGANSYLLIFPLKMAFEAVGQDNPAIGIWLKRILDQISSGVAGKWGAVASLLQSRPRRG
ncbi:hypothetical protein EG329_002312 [Mollisiaceae sp. DMI_Dod_QoI]|nr:hypothetical protein EG329_002312 [Helotiales sp. DMI_Dod_QoI]